MHMLVEANDQHRQLTRPFSDFDCMGTCCSFNLERAWHPPERSDSHQAHTASVLAVDCWANKISPAANNVFISRYARGHTILCAAHAASAALVPCPERCGRH